MTLRQTDLCLNPYSGFYKPNVLRLHARLSLYHELLPSVKKGHEREASRVGHVTLPTFMSKPISPNPPRWKSNPDPANVAIPGLDTEASTIDQIEQIEQLITIKLQVWY